MLYKKNTLFAIGSMFVFGTHAMQNDAIKPSENAYRLGLTQQELKLIFEEIDNKQEEEKVQFTTQKDQQAIDQANRIVKLKRNIVLLKKNIQQIKNNIQDIKNKKIITYRGSQLQWKDDSDVWASSSSFEFDEANEMGLSIFD